MPMTCCWMSGWVGEEAEREELGENEPGRLNMPGTDPLAGLCVGRCQSVLSTKSCRLAAFFFVL